MAASGYLLRRATASVMRLSNSTISAFRHYLRASIQLPSASSTISKTSGAQKLPSACPQANPSFQPQGEPRRAPNKKIEKRMEYYGSEVPNEIEWSDF